MRQPISDAFFIFAVFRDVLVFSKDVRLKQTYARQRRAGDEIHAVRAVDFRNVTCRRLVADNAARMHTNAADFLISALRLPCVRAQNRYKLFDVGRAFAQQLHRFYAAFPALCKFRKQGFSITFYKVKVGF